MKTALLISYLFVNDPHIMITTAEIVENRVVCEIRAGMLNSPPIIGEPLEVLTIEGHDVLLFLAECNE